MTTTSTTLLKAIGADLDSPRWTEFVARYQPVMESFLAQQFPSVDADDVMQETLIVIARVLPDYHYAPDTKGHFRNYLLGILKNKAHDGVRMAMPPEMMYNVRHEDTGRVFFSGSQLRMRA